ncbi:MAG: hypothetical protein LBU48_00885 [Coriobacteriales bacterium]|jgi:hypothetical protein|nr:hypothetical protein [Coriobacteriales bacterium]
MKTLPAKRLLLALLMLASLALLPGCGKDAAPAEDLPADEVSETAPGTEPETEQAPTADAPLIIDEGADPGSIVSVADQLEEIYGAISVHLGGRADFEITADPLSDGEWYAIPIRSLAANDTGTPADVVLRRVDGTLTVVSLGTGISAEQYAELGVPDSLIQRILNGGLH